MGGANAMVDWGNVVVEPQYYGDPGTVSLISILARGLCGFPCLDLVVVMDSSIWNTGMGTSG